MEKNSCRILAIETSSPTLSLALLENNNILAEYNIFAGNKHDKLCAEFSRRLLEDNSLTIDDLTAVAVSIGPGSFTGLRIGLAFAKGLTFTNTPKLITVPTLAAMIKNAAMFIQHIKNHNNLFDKIKIVAVAPSHSNLYYYQEATQELLQYENMLLNLYSSEVQTIDQESLIAKYKHSQESNNIFLTTTQKINLPFGMLLPEMSNIKASIIANFATELLEKNITCSSESAVPMYVQDFVPKVFPKKSVIQNI